MELAHYASNWDAGGADAVLPIPLSVVPGNQCRFVAKFKYCRSCHERHRIPGVPNAPGRNAGLWAVGRSFATSCARGQGAACSNLFRRPGDAGVIRPTGSPRESGSAVSLPRHRLHPHQQAGSSVLAAACSAAAISACAVAGTTATSTALAACSATCRPAALSARFPARAA